MQEQLTVLQPARLGGITLRNRLVVPPMETYLATEDGQLTDAYIGYVEARSKGGFGLFILEATYVDVSGKGFTKGCGIDNDDKLPGLTRLTEAVHRHGGKIAVQLHHAGRETSASVTGSTIMAPSDCPVCYSDEKVHELTVEEIHFLVQRFAEAAVRAKKAGFDAVMLHGAHGYLLTQFLSPYTNKRTDAYGGSLENRLRISLEVIDAVRKAVGPDFPVTYRMTVEEGVPGGLSLQESARAAAILSRSGIDCLHVVAGNYATNQLIIAPAACGSVVNKARLQVIRAAVGPDFPLTVAGRITNVFQAEELVREGLAQFVAMGRASIADPELPALSLAGHHDAVRTCIGCNDACIGRTSRELSVGCALNPLAGQEALFADREKAETPRRVLVIGAGPAGLEAACIAAKRGHSVTLYEKQDHIGGQFFLAAMPPHKDAIFTYLHHMKKRLELAGVTLRCNCNVTEEVLAEEKPDVVILATGGRPLEIPFAGLETMHCVTAQAVLTDQLDSLGQRVAVIGGGLVGCETAEFVAATGREVHVIEMMDTLIPDLFFTVRAGLLSRLDSLGIQLHAGCRVQRFADNAIICLKDGGEVSFGPVDSVVMALGVRPENSLEAILQKLNISFVKAGDCAGQGNCRKATQAALAAYDM